MVITVLFPVAKGVEAIQLSVHKWAGIHTDTDTDTDTDIHTHTDTHTYTDTQTHTHTHYLFMKQERRKSCH